ncbi:MAG: ferritin family protein [Candidatus Woesearchaeota archaeon]
MKLKQALQTALEFEQKGHDIYIKASQKTNNPIVKKTFAYLAEQEINHINEIKQFIKTEHPDFEFKGDTLEGVQKMFKDIMKDFKEKTELSGDDIKAHETALHLEKSAYNFYKEQLGQIEKLENPDKHNISEDEKQKMIRFFTFLMEQENAHYEFIQKAYEFIKDPVSFFSGEEGWIVEG